MARWPDYVLRGAAVVILLLILVWVFGADDAPPTTFSASSAQEADPAERDLFASVSHPDAVWERVAFVLRRLGHIDDGAVTAVTQRRASLLAAGITGVRGSFAAGDPVDITDASGTVVARGLVNFDAAELPALLGRSSHELKRELGAGYEREVVHRDDLVVL